MVLKGHITVTNVTFLTKRWHLDTLTLVFVFDAEKTTDRVNIMNPKQSDFQYSTVPLKPTILIKTITESLSPIRNASIGSFKVEIGRLYSPQPTFEFP